MGLLSRLFGKKEPKRTVRQREDQPDVINVSSESERMNWAIEKANLTLHYFEACLKSPKPNQDYISIKVKIEDAGMAEHIWLMDPSFDEDANLFGVIGNEPIDVRNVSLGQKIGIDRTKISDWMIIEGGRLIGGYTIRALREGLTGSALASFDAQLGGMIVDDGEDYFEVNDALPEGAILLIEEAYDNDDLDKALACKDFDIEAKIMLSKMENMEMDDSILKSTAEVLKLSFMKFLQESGMPKFNGVKRAFPKREIISDDHIIVTEVCYYPDGGKSVQRLNTHKTDSGWKVMGPEE